MYLPWPVAALPLGPWVFGGPAAGCRICMVKAHRQTLHSLPRSRKFHVSVVRSQSKVQHETPRRREKPSPVNRTLTGRGRIETPDLRPRWACDCSRYTPTQKYLKPRLMTTAVPERVRPDWLCPK